MGNLLALFQELKRRRVFRVAAVYIVSAFALLQAADIIFPALRLPDFTITFFLVILILGFPFAMMLAWAYDITPEGVQRTPTPLARRRPRREEGEEGEKSEEPRSPARRPATDREGKPLHSVAALPFANLSSDEENEYLADGITEELINALTKIEGLRVAARTSSFAFKDKSVDVREIGQRLGVEIVIEGSVRRMQDRLRIGVQMISVEDGYHLWSDSFDRQLEDVFVLQEEIARAVAAALKVKLADEAQPSRARAPTGNVEAATLYLKGRHFWNRRTGEGLRSAVDHFSRAIALDPDFALAHAGLADAYAILLDYGILSREEALPRLRAAARRALELDATLAEAHTSLALAHQFDWQWAAAEREFRRAIELNPSYAIAHHRYALFLAWMDRPEESLRQIRRAEEIDPLSLIILTTVGWVLYYARRYEEAVEQCQRTLEMEADFLNAHIVLGLALGQVGRHAEAVAAHRRAVELAGDSVSTRALLGYSYGAAGERERAEQVRAQLEASAASAYVPPYYLAVAALGSGESEEAIGWLERAYTDHSAHLVYLRVDPLFDPLRADPRLERLLDQLGLGETLTAGAEAPRA